jgi:hypothetical protein
MRVLVCGGRDFEDVAFAHATLDRLHAEHRFRVLIEGDARGADRIAGEWADRRGLEHVKFPADWEGLGRAAGPIRNAQMLREGKPDLVIALPGHRGTAHMVRIARAAGVRVIEIAKPAGAA